MNEIKTVLDIDLANNSENTKLLFFAEQVTSLINNYLGREQDGIDFKSRVQYYQGTGTQKLLLRNRPVYPTPASPYSTISVIVDSGGYYGTATNAFTNTALTYGTDYTLQIDQTNGSSRSGILIRLNDYWNKPSVRQVGLLSPFIGPDTGSIKITYTAGFVLDDLPAVFRLAANLLIAEIRRMAQNGTFLQSESYEERSVSYMNRRYLWEILQELLLPYRNWKW